MPPPITVRGAGRSKGVPSGYILGRSSKGNGDVELLSARDFHGVGIASTASVGAAVSNIPFIQLTDVPQTYAASGLKVVRVNAGATGLEFVTQNALTSTTLTITGAGTAAVTINMPASGVTAGSYTNANITVDTQGRVTAASNGSVGVPYIPLSSGDLLIPALIFGNGMTISVPLTTAKMDTTIIAYIATGLAAARPATPVLTTGASSAYLASDTGKFFVWSGSAWVQTN